jgi:hypothetical protein
MRKYSLNIADYIISFESSGSGPDLIPENRFLRNISKDPASDLLITIHNNSFELPAGAEKVFHAPLVEEINGTMIKHGDNFWSVYKHRSDIYIKTIFPQSKTGKEGLLKFSLTSRKWDLYLHKAGKETDPLEYPLDGLILYYLTVMYGDIMIHASGVNHSGNGYLFSGVSGKGKSTMARLWDKSGTKVIHDDRLIIRKTTGSYFMHNTPVYNDDEPRSAPLKKIFLIDHGLENKMIPVRGATAVSMVMANGIQHSWNKEIIAGMMGSLSVLCSYIPVYKLSFKPNRTIIDYILENE